MTALHPHNQTRSTPQEAFNLQRTAQVYGTRAFTPVNSKAARRESGNA